MQGKRKTGSVSATRSSRSEKPLSRESPRTPRRLPEETERLIDELTAQNEKLKVRQREIEAERMRYLDLYDFAPIGYFILNRKGTIIDLNLTGARLLGLPKNQAIDLPFAFFLPRDYLHAFNQHLRKVFSTGAGARCELRLSRKYQKSVDYVSVESVALNRDGDATCWSAVFDVTEKKSAEKEILEARQELIQKNVQLRHLSSRLLEVQEEERTRVAVDVHDSFASQLCAIREELRPLLGKGEDDRLNQVFTHLNTAIRDAGRIQYSLRPPALDDLGLISALNMLCRNFQNRHPYVRVEKELLPAEENVPHSIETPIYRIAEEALENIATHSHADLLVVSIIRRDSLIEFSIRDNGQGFNVEEILSSGAGKGLLMMRERAMLSGGTFEIESTIGKGTTLRASWPSG